jgi:hypothetical protein
MLKHIFITIILYIIIKHFMDASNIHASNISTSNISTSNISTSNTSTSNTSTSNTSTSNTSTSNTSKLNSNESKVIINDKPNPWTKVIINQNDEYPFLYHIKIKIPSLNDFENWKKIIPNLNFDPLSGELIIPSKDEQSALAIANLILINFSGKMTIQHIVEKNLIQISIAKTKSYELVQNKIRAQIMDELYGKQINKPITNYQQDLAVKKPIENNKRLDFKSESFTDTFVHFTSNDLKSNESNIGAWDGGNFSYL